MINGSSAVGRNPSLEHKRGSGDAQGSGTLNGIEVRQLAAGGGVPSHKKTKSEASGLTSMFRKLADFTVTLGGPNPRQLAMQMEGRLSQSLPGIGASLRNQVLQHGGIPKNGQEAAEKVSSFLSTVHPSPKDKMDELNHWAKQLGITADAKSLLLVFEAKHGENLTFEKFALSLPEFFRTYDGEADREFNAKAGQIRSTGDSQIADHMRKVDSKRLPAHQNASVSADTKSKAATGHQKLPELFLKFFEGAEFHALEHFRDYCVSEHNHENFDFILESRTFQNRDMNIDQRLEKGRELLVRHEYLNVSERNQGARLALIAQIPERQDQVATLPGPKKAALAEQLKQVQKQLHDDIVWQFGADAYGRYVLAQDGRYPQPPDLNMIS